MWESVRFCSLDSFLHQSPLSVDASGRQYWTIDPFQKIDLPSQTRGPFMT